MKSVIITGATGMVGQLALQQCLNDSTIAKVTILVRRPTGQKHAKLNEVVHTHFTDYSTISNQLTGHDLCIYCIGVYTGQVPPPEFKVITVDYTHAFATALRAHSPNATFCFLSGQGADSTEKSKILFAREKGIAENILLGLHFPHTHLFRPGYIYPDVARKEPNAMYTAMRFLYPPLKGIFPSIGVPASQLAAKMVQVGLNGSDKVIYEHRDILA